MKAFTLFDLGCTMDTISPELTRVTRMKVHELSLEVPLQLGTVGGKSKIIFGATAKVEYASIKDECYVDIINIDKYDTIIGTVFMRKYGISLNFEQERITIKGVPALTMTITEEKETIACRHLICEPPEPKKV